MDTERIVIEQNNIEKSQELHDTLEKLYLGEPKKYHIYVHQKHLNKLEELFDQIIMKYGIRGVSFEYFLMENLVKKEA